MPVVLAMVVAGCSNADELSRRDKERVALASADISFYCVDGSFRNRVPGHVRALIAIHDKDPTAIYVHSSESQSPMDKVLRDVAKSLDRCDRERAEQLRGAADE